MKSKIKFNKKAVVTIPIVCAIIAGTYEYVNNIDFTRQVNRALSSLVGVNYSIPKDATTYKDADFVHDTYYVYKDGKRQFLSLNPNLKGYKLQGMYNSTNSMEEIAYMYSTTDYNYSTNVNVYSYDDLEAGQKIWRFVDEDEIAIIDEKAIKENPDVSAYIPECSIIKKRG